MTDAVRNYIGNYVDEYAGTVSGLDPFDSPERIVGALVAEGAWTDRGATALVQLATEYGAFILRHAAALATALEIEDGERRL